MVVWWVYCCDGGMDGVVSVLLINVETIRSILVCFFALVSRTGHYILFTFVPGAGKKAMYSI